MRKLEQILQVNGIGIMPVSGASDNLLKNSQVFYDDGSFVLVADDGNRMYKGNIGSGLVIGYNRIDSSLVGKDVQAVMRTSFGPGHPMKPESDSLSQQTFEPYSALLTLYSSQQNHHLVHQEIPLSESELEINTMEHLSLGVLYNGRNLKLTSMKKVECAKAGQLHDLPVADLSLPYASDLYLMIDAEDKPVTGILRHQATIRAKDDVVLILNDLYDITANAYNGLVYSFTLSQSGNGKYTVASSSRRGENSFFNALPDKSVLPKLDLASREGNIYVISCLGNGSRPLAAR